MSKFSDADFYGHRNMDEAIAAADQGNSAARDLIARTVLSQYKRENPFNPRMPDHRKMEDLMNQFKEEYKENERRSETPSYSEIVRGPNTPRPKSPTRQSNKVAAEEKDAEEVEKNRWYLGKHLVSAYKSLTPKPRAESSTASRTLTKGNPLAYRRSNTMVARKRGGSKKTRKNRKSSRRNRK
jgi:hypothetical protein